MSSSSSMAPVYKLSLDHWESIAFHLAASEDKPGPPSGLNSLLLVSRHVYANTCSKNNVGLYARLFRLKFDCGAIRRRLSERWMTDRCLRSELIKRFTALRRIRGHIYKFDDLWTCYLMFVSPFLSAAVWLDDKIGCWKTMGKMSFMY